SLPAESTSAALAERYEPPRGEAGVSRPGTDEAVVFGLFDDMGGPADDPADDEQRGVEFDGEAQVMVQPGARPIEIGPEAFFVEHHFFDDVGRLFEVGAAGLFGQLPARLAEDDGTGIAVFVDAMAEAHDAAFLSEGVADPGFGG